VGVAVTAAPPDIVVDHSALWAPVTAGDEIEPWSVATAQDLWRRSGQPHSRPDVDRLAAKLAVLGEAVQRSDSYGGFLLCPDLARGPLSVVRLNGLSHPDLDVQAVLDDFLFPAEQQLLRPEIEHVSGPGLPRIRVRQRAYTDDDTRSLTDFVAYFFPFHDASWVLSVSFLDPLQAERWLPELDALAAGVQLRGAGA
jgi:hypothetical protein